MHEALGEFFTELGRVEFRMLLFMDGINEAPIEEMFAEYSAETFGGKIRVFKKWCEFGHVSEDEKQQLEQLYADLKALKLKRNMLAHGETWEGAFHGRSYQPYRVAIVEGNLDYLDDLEHGEHGDNVFDLERVKEVTKECVRLHTTLRKMLDDHFVGAEIMEADIGDLSDWPPSTAGRVE